MPSGAFAISAVVASGPVAIGSNRPGAFAPAAAPNGGFGGVMGAGIRLEFGSPTFASIYHFEGVGIGGFAPKKLRVGTRTLDGTCCVGGGFWGTSAQPTVYATFIAPAGFDTRTPGGAGTIQLIAPAVVRTSLGPIQPPLPFAAVGRLTLTFTPEPAAALLLSLTAAAALGARTIHRRH